MVMEEFARLRESVPELREAHLCNIATQLGITESRRLVGRSVLTAAHGRGRRGHLRHRTLDEYETIYPSPYPCLVTRETGNLLAASRIISVDHRVHHATKEIPACMAVGQAAGEAAALALDQDGDVRAVDAAILRARLVAGGALLDYFDAALNNNVPAR